MINNDSIVTAYDEHLTLVEWLQKVEKALDNAVLTNLGIAKLSDQGNVATYQVTATFADNTTIVSNAFTLPSTNIVTAFDNLTALVNGFDDRITDNTNDVASIIDIIDIGNDKIKASTLQNSINGSDEVIVDIDATNEKLEIHLSAELQAKLARVLLKPSSAPTTRKVVTIDTNGAQDNIDPTELPALMNNIVDSQGNKRFVEGDITMNIIEGITQTYGKWSLSGTHLMIVFAGTFENGVSLPVNIDLVSFTLPTWILNKIIPVWGNFYIENKNTPCYADDWSSQSVSMVLRKVGDRIDIRSTSAVNFTAKRNFHIQYDLLIDND